MTSMSQQRLQKTSVLKINKIMNLSIIFSMCNP